GDEGFERRPALEAVQVTKQGFECTCHEETSLWVGHQGRSRNLLRSWRAVGFASRGQPLLWDAPVLSYSMFPLVKWHRQDVSFRNHPCIRPGCGSKVERECRHEKKERPALLGRPLLASADRLQAHHGGEVGRISSYSEWSMALPSLAST